MAALHSHDSSQTRLLHALILLALGALSGCRSEPGIPPDHSAVAKLDRIVIYIVRQEPRFDTVSQASTEIEEDSPEAAALRAFTPNELKEIEAVKGSGVYDIFAHELADYMEAATGKVVHLMNKSDYRYTGEGQDAEVDVLASAREAGYDAVLVALVRPSLYIREGEAIQHRDNPGLEVQLSLRRVSDRIILWEDSLQVGGQRFSQTTQNMAPSWFRLGQKAAAEAARKYAAGV